MGEDVEIFHPGHNPFFCYFNNTDIPEKYLNLWGFLEPPGHTKLKRPFCLLCAGIQQTAGKGLVVRKSILQLCIHLTSSHWKELA